MEDELLRKLKAGLEEEIRNYESMLNISRQEQEVLRKEAYSSQLIALASEKLRLMNDINRIGIILSPLKAMWVKERESVVDAAPENEIDPLIGHLSEVLEDLLAIDKANAEKLAEMTGAASDDGPLHNADPVAAARTYKNVAAK